MRKIYGAVIDVQNGGAPVKGLRVSAWDDDWLDGDDFMGSTITNSDGYYEISYSDKLWNNSLPGMAAWRPDIYVTLEIRNTRNKWVFLGKSQVFKDHDLNRDLRIDLRVNLQRKEKKVISFDPELHGFHFVNNFKMNAQILGLGVKEKGMGFCGGMCAATLNRFKRNLNIPDNQQPPPQGQPLFEELKERQIKTMHPSVLAKMYSFQSAPDQISLLRKSCIGQLTRREWPPLKVALDDDRPCILVLIRASGFFGNPTKNHQVVAFGYEFDPSTKDLVIYEYDPNKPDQTQTLAMNLGLPDGRLYLKDSAWRGTRGFFISPVSDTASE